MFFFSSHWFEIMDKYYTNVIKYKTQFSEHCKPKYKPFKIVRSVKNTFSYFINNKNNF